MDPSQMTKSFTHNERVSLQCLRLFLDIYQAGVVCVEWRGHMSRPSPPCVRYCCIQICKRLDLNKTNKEFIVPCCT